MIDQMLNKRKDWNEVSEGRVLRGAVFDTDHNLARTKLRFKVRSEIRKQNF